MVGPMRSAAQGPVSSWPAEDGDDAHGITIGSARPSEGWEAPSSHTHSRQPLLSCQFSVG